MIMSETHTGVIIAEQKEDMSTTAQQPPPGLSAGESMAAPQGCVGNLETHY